MNVVFLFQYFISFIAGHIFFPEQQLQQSYETVSDFLVAQVNHDYVQQVVGFLIGLVPVKKVLFFHAITVDGALAVGGIHTDEYAVDFFDAVIVGAFKIPFLLAGHDAAHIVQRSLQYVVTKGGGFLCFLGFHINDKGDKVTGFRGFGVEKDVKSDLAFGRARFLIPVALNFFRDGIGLVLVQWNPADFRRSFNVDIGNIFFRFAAVEMTVEAGSADVIRFLSE